MRNKDNRHTGTFELLNPPHAALLKKHVADRQCFVDDENIRFHMDSHRKGQADEHAARVNLHGPVYKVADLRKSFDVGNSLACLSIGEAENRSIEIDVFPPGELRIETGAKLKQR